MRCSVCKTPYEEHVFNFLKGLAGDRDPHCPCGGIIDTEQKGPWYKDFCEDSSLWDFEVFDMFPSIIAHEYWRLFDLLKSGQTYGAFLQLKDVFEVLLKFPTLLAVSELYFKDAWSENKEKTHLFSLLQKPLTLGDWERIAQKIIKEKQIYPNVQRLLKDIVSIFNNSIVHWRNEKIGHGALAFDDNEEFQEDMKKKLKLVKDHFDRIGSIYKDGRFYMMKDGEKTELCGKEYGRNIILRGEKLYFASDEYEQELYPFIVLYRKGIYLFDSYYSRKKTAALLNYPEGVKDSLNKDVNTVIDSVYSHMNNAMSRISERKSIDSHTFSELDLAVLNHLYEVSDFQKPDYLVEWVEKVIDKHKKGVFLLQMERGTGKSTFARALDELSLNKVKIEDCSVRAYYINDSYAYKVQNFTLKLHDIFRQDSQEKTIIGGIQPPSIQAGDKKKELSEFLKQYRQEHKEQFGKEKLLFILDGLDEIPPKEDITIFDFIPDEEMLEEGIYIFLTCRTNEEFRQSEFTKSRMSQLQVTERRESTKDENCNVLTSFIRTKIFGIAKENEKLTEFQQENLKLILEQSEYRFLYVKALRDLLQTSNDTIDINSLPKDNDLFLFYLEQLRFLYGEKHFRNVVRLLIVIATAKEPLTFREISWLTGEEQPTYKLLAHLVDLRGFLQIERSYRGNLISISHNTIRQIVIDAYKDEITNLLNEWLTVCTKPIVEEETSWSSDENEGLIYLLVYIRNLTEEFSPNKYKNISGEFFYKLLLEAAYALQYTSQFNHQRRRTLLLFTNAITIMQELWGQGNLKDVNDLPRAINNRGRIYMELLKFEEALKDHLAARNLRIDWKDKGVYREDFALASCIMNIGVAYTDLNRPKDALYHYNQAIQILRELSNQPDAEQLMDKLFLEKKLVDYDIVALGLRNRAYTYRLLNNLDAALNNINESIELYRAFLQKGKRIDPLRLPNALEERGLLYIDLGLPEQAMMDFEEAISIKQRLKMKGKLMEEDSLSLTLMNKGVVLLHQNRANESIALLREVVRGLRKLMEEGKLSNKHMLAYALHNLGVAYLDSGRPREALSLTQEAVKIREELIEEGSLKDENELARSLYNLGTAYLKLEYSHEATVTFIKSMKIRNELLQHEERYLTNRMLLDICHSGTAFQLLGRDDKAIQEFEQLEQGIRLLEERGKPIAIQEKLFFQEQIAYNLMERQQYELAIERYKELLGVAKKLKHEEISEEILPRISINLGYCYEKIGFYDCAERKYLHAKELLLLLDIENSNWVQGNLFITLNNLGSLYLLIDQIELARNELLEATKRVEKLPIEQEFVEISLFIQTLHNLILQFRKTERYQETIQVYNSAITILTKYYHEDNMRFGNDLGMMYLGRGSVYRDYLHQPEIARDDFENGIHIVLSIKEKGMDFPPDFLFDLYIDMGDIYRRLKLGNEALKSYQSALTIKEVFSNKESAEPDRKLAKAILRAGIVHCDILRKYDLAILSFSEVIEICKNHLNTGNTDFSKLLRIATKNRAIAHLNTGEFNSTIEDIDELIAYHRKLIEEGIIHSKGALINALELRYSLLYNIFRNYKEALISYSEMIDIRRKQWEEGSLKDSTLLISLLLKRGLIYCDYLQQYNEALFDFQQAIELIKSLEVKNRVAGARRNKTWSTALMNRGVSLQRLGKSDLALNDYNQAMIIWEELLQGNDFSKDESFLSLLRNRIILFLETGEYEKASQDMQQLEQLTQGMTTVKTNIAGRYEQAIQSRSYATMFYLTQQWEKAITYYTQAIDKLSAIYKANQPIDINDLMEILINRGVAYLAQEEYEKANTDFQHAMEKTQLLEQEGALRNIIMPGYARSFYGITLHYLNQSKEAFPHLTEGRNALTRVLEKNSSAILASSLALNIAVTVEIYIHCERIEEAKKIYTQYLHIFEQYGSSEIIQGIRKGIKELLDIS